MSRALLFCARLPPVRLRRGKGRAGDRPGNFGVQTDSGLNKKHIYEQTKNND